MDPAIAGRRVGLRQKGPPAHEVLEASFGLRTVRDLLHHYPRRYIDRSDVALIRDLRVGQQATVIATVRRVSKRLTRRRQSMITVALYDGTGYLEATFFNQPWIERIYRQGQEVAVSGTVATYRGHLQMANQEVEILRGEAAESIHTGRITPVHPATEGVTTRTIRELVFRSLERLPLIPDPLPTATIEQEGLPPYDWALRSLHFPDAPEQLERARERLKFDELFTLELGVAFRKHRVESASVGVPHEPEGPLVKQFLETLPWEPTRAQSRAMDEVAEAMERPRPMNRLLQGDVGSGKTVVALYACLIGVQSGHQAAVMAPTEVLAGQHHRAVAELLAGVGARSFLDVGDAGGGQPSLFGETTREGELRYALLSASVTGRDRVRVLEGVRRGEVDLLVGTHALVQEAVEFHDLSLAVIDEQHRFGVHQRMALRGKGAEPDVLIMTATPIPRTMAMTYYGDLDVSVLDEMPAGRQPIETRVVRTTSDRARAYDLVRQEVAAGRQAFVVCAAIDEENRLEVKAAEKEAERLAREVFPSLSVDVLHGRMRPAEKDRRMHEFRAGRCDVLISTTVVEVGVDVPNATVMLVENAERFGLAQLHQLRGRIGRGSHRSYCFLFDESAPGNEEARGRLDALARSGDGFALAEEDLRLRGEGTLFHIRQSGMPDLKLARLADDAPLVRRARARAFALVEEDPSLTRHPSLRSEMEERFRHSIEWLFHS